MKRNIKLEKIQPGSFVFHKTTGELYRYLGIKVVVDGYDPDRYTQHAEARTIARLDRQRDGHVIRVSPSSENYMELSSG